MNAEKGRWIEMTCKSRSEKTEEAEKGLGDWLMSGWREPRRGWEEGWRQNPVRGLGARGHVQEGTVSSLCGNAVTLGRHFLSSVAPGTMGRAAFCRGNEGVGWAEGTREGHRPK